MFRAALSKAAAQSTWVYWLVNNDGDAAHSTREFLQTCFVNLPVAKHARLLKTLATEKAAENIDACIHELVAHELLRRLGLSPEFHPVITKSTKTPDLRFEAGGKPFLADVYLTHSPAKTFKKYPGEIGTYAAWDTAKPEESRAQKIKNELAKKSAKYKVLGLPLVLFVFLGDHISLNTEDVERALFGMTAYETSLEPRFPKSVHRDRVPVGGLLLPQEDGSQPYTNLSAVVLCDWFDTLNREDRGKRLHCVVLHHWAAEDTLPQEAFQCFPQIIWYQTTRGIWKPEQTRNANVAPSFTLVTGIECREYTPNTAW